MLEYMTDNQGRKRHEAFIQEIFIDMSQWEAEEKHNDALIEIDELFRNFFDENEGEDEAMWF